MAGRWAFLSFKDVVNEVNSVADLTALGSLTLMIEDILEVKPAKQELLFQYFDQVRSSNEGTPMFIIGSSSPLEDLKDEGMVHPGLVAFLKQQRLEVDRLPRDSQRLQETLEIMLQF